MRSTLIIAFAAAIAAAGVDSAPAGKDDRLRLKIIKHQPCTSRPTASERIRFPNLRQASLVEDARRGGGCYVINGPTTVSKAISGVVQVYSEVKFGVQSALEQCRKADGNGCGGVGSCVYCDVCKEGRSIDRSSSGLVRLESKSTDCRAGLSPGTYSDLRISFCMPTKRDVLQSLNVDEEFWEKNAAEGRVFFVTLYVFDEKVNGLSSAQLRKKATTDNRHVIGCHKIVGSIYAGDN